jgi:hypothetical protein
MLCCLLNSAACSTKESSPNLENLDICVDSLRKTTTNIGQEGHPLGPLARQQEVDAARTQWISRLCSRKLEQNCLLALDAVQSGVTGGPSVLPSGQSKDPAGARRFPEDSSGRQEWLLARLAPQEKCPELPISREPRHCLYRGSYHGYTNALCAYN